MISDELARQGFAGPVPVFSPAECADILARLTAEAGEPPVWGKAWAASSAAWHRVATDPRIVALVQPALGDDVVLWGASLIVKQDNDVHAFHTDIESMAPDGGFVTVWIGLENTHRSSGLKFVPGSHLWRRTIQEANHLAGIERGQSTDETTLAAARQFDPAASIVQPEVGDGEALVFDGRAWHGSHNQTKLRRSALLIQFARAGCPVRIPRRFDWPMAFRKARPPVVLVSGRPDRRANLVLRAPGLHGPVAGGVHRLPATVEPSLPYLAFPHLRGRTPRLDVVMSHSSILTPGTTPHPPTAHIEEEILLVVSGEAELQTADDAAGTGLERQRMGAGDFAYYPAFLHHTLVNVGSGPLHYTMFKWANPGKPDDPRAAGKIFVRAGATLAGEVTGFGKPLWEARTRWLKRLHAHASILSPGTVLEPHADPYDVAIVLFSGTVETAGKVVEGPALLFHPAGEPHGLRAVGDSPARYLVFEFDDSHAPLSLLARTGRRLANRVRTWLPR